mgnify:CR=1 FL=1
MTTRTIPPKPSREVLEVINSSVHYAMFSVFAVTTPLGDDDRAALAAEVDALFAELTEGGVRIRGVYDVAGLRADADLMVWWHAETIEQLQLALEASEVAVAKMIAKLHLPEEEEKDKPKRRPIPDHIPRQEIELTTGDEDCSHCGGTLRRLGEDVTEELEYVPGRFIVNRIVRPRMACSGCEAFTQAPSPSRPIERGRPGPGLLAHVLVSKYADHLPLYRQIQIFEREGLDLNRSTLADWVGKSTTLLEPLADAIGRHVLAGQAIFANDTPVKMLTPGTGKTATARLWAYGRRAALEWRSPACQLV